MPDIFDKNGNAIEITVVTVYGYNGQNGEFTGAYDVRVMAGTGIPGLSTLLPVPEVQEREVAVYADNKWTVEPDFRAETVYSTSTGEPAAVDYIGPLHAGYTDVAPATPFDKWNGAEWVADTDAQHAADVAAAEQQKAALRQSADAEIDWRQDAVGAGIATEEETAALTDWKKYRVQLMRVDTSKAPDIVWPPVPE
ncbi:tail fiber assembly protein [[Enterobacter] lignolyticus]|uniref:Phage tail protein n=1 Tax=[Enterobacter] lignolyticus TaxID=1334193 RepID=A0A806X527_9ENTR|nr:tail fiber assembly protein [[Enterobacter] lignolyticus]ALR75852.1 phage tail protein [[Enterobacter] lignolyticus]